MTTYQRLKSAAGHLPGVVIALVVAACLLMAFSSLAEELQYDRSAVISGQWWRIAACHLTHWSLDHLFWDVTALLFLGLVIEPDKRSRLLACIGLSAVLIPVAVYIWMPELSTYRGLSGIDSAVFMLLATVLLGDSWSRRDRGWTLACMAVMGGFVVKIGFEYVTGTALFVDTGAAKMTPVPLAHVIGGGLGILCGLPWKAVTASRGPLMLGGSGERTDNLTAAWATGSIAGSAGRGLVRHDDRPVEAGELLANSSLY